MGCFMVNGGQDAGKIALIMSSVKGGGEGCGAYACGVFVCAFVTPCGTACVTVHARVHDNTVHICV